MIIYNVKQELIEYIDITSLLKMKQKTAVEYLEESLINLEDQRDQLWSGLYLEWLKNFIEQAKAIEKEQIIQAYKIGSIDMLSINEMELDAEKYYKNKYQK